MENIEARFWGKQVDTGQKKFPASWKYRSFTQDTYQTKKCFFNIKFLRWGCDIFPWWKIQGWGLLIGGSRDCKHSRRGCPVPAGRCPSAAPAYLPATRSAVRCRQRSVSRRNSASAGGAAARNAARRGLCCAARSAGAAAAVAECRRHWKAKCTAARAGGPQAGGGGESAHTGRQKLGEGLQKMANL